MPPRKSRSREREPPSSPSQPEGLLNSLSPDSSTRDQSVSSHPQASGEFTPLRKPEDQGFNLNGRRSRSANTLRTLPGPVEERASKGATSSRLIPTSPNYFDLLSDGEDNSESDPLPVVKTPTERKTIRFTDKLQVFITLPPVSTGIDHS